MTDYPTTVIVKRRSETELEIELDGERYILAPLSRIRSTALEMASKLSTPGATADRVLTAAAEYEAYLMGKPDAPKHETLGDKIDAAMERALQIAPQGPPDTQELAATR